MIDIVDRLSFDAVRCEATFSRGVASNIEDGITEIKRLRAIVGDACEVLRHYDLPEHAFHYERVLRGEAPLTVQQQPAEKS